MVRRRSTVRFRKGAPQVRGTFDRFMTAKFTVSILLNLTSWGPSGQQARPPEGSWGPFTTAPTWPPTARDGQAAAAMRSSPLSDLAAFKLGERCKALAGVRAALVAMVHGVP
jgi:hypothetical protein